MHACGRPFGGILGREPSDGHGKMHGTGPITRRPLISQPVRLARRRRRCEEGPQRAPTWSPEDTHSTPAVPLLPGSTERSSFFERYFWMLCRAKPID